MIADLKRSGSQAWPLNKRSGLGTRSFGLPQFPKLKLNKKNLDVHSSKSF